jgi:hypothetical protein
MGEQEATVLEVQPFALHGVTYYDVVVRFADQSIETARLGPEGIPDGLRPGERVMARQIGKMIVSLHRP